MSEILIHRTRGKVVETIHRGDAAVVDSSGKLVAYCGEPDKYTYFRSSAKPLQAMNMLLSGAMEAFGIDAKELALICSSHYSEDYHIETVRSILAKIGLGEKDLQCGVARSINSEIAFAQAERGIGAQRIKSDCSGKHSGILATCVKKGFTTHDYLDPRHPVQQEILELLAEICVYPKDEIEIGIDGCNVPVFALPIRYMALGYARMANPEYLRTDLQAHAKTIFEAMNAHPEMVSGTGGFCTALMKVTGGKLIGKVGAQGVYCVGIKDANLGLAVKIEDGSPGLVSCAVMQILKELDMLSQNEYEELAHYHIAPNLNDDKIKVGEIYPVFDLVKA